MSPSLEQVVGDPAFALRLNGLSGKIAGLKHASEVTEVLGEISSLMGCNGAVFMSFAREDDSFESYRYFVACPPYWCNLYIAQRWFMIDPALIYAQLHSEPVCGDAISFATEGQRTLRRHADEAGFRSFAVVPAHSAGGRSRMGVLYMTSSDPAYFTQATLGFARMYLRAVAAELLDWWIHKMRSDLLQNVAAKPEELQLLRLAHEGYPTKEIAQMIGLKPAAVDQRFARIAMRFNAPSRAAAARIAYEHGLLET